MRVVIAEDLALLRDGMVRLLEANGFEVVAAVDNGDALVHAVRLDAPDVAIVDIRLPPSFRDEGLRAALELRATAPDVGILVVSQYVERTYATELLAGAGAAGGIGYLLKDRVLDVDDFVEAVRRVGSGGAALDPEVVAQLLGGRAASPLDDLSPREREVLGLMAEGRSNAGIAEALVLTVSAVEKHITSLFQKLDLEPDESGNRRVLAALAHISHSGAQPQTGDLR